VTNNLTRITAYKLTLPFTAALTKRPKPKTTLVSQRKEWVPIVTI